MHTIVVVRGEVEPDAVVVPLEAVVADVDPAAAAQEIGTAVTADEPYVIVYTSGTTARPKGCVHTFNTYASGARSLTGAFAFASDGERLCCYVVPSDPTAPPSLDDLKSYLQERGLAVQKAPGRLELVAALPMTATGKIQKHLLRQDVARKVEKAGQVPADA